MPKTSYKNVKLWIKSVEGNTQESFLNSSSDKPQGESTFQNRINEGITSSKYLIRNLSCFPYETEACNASKWEDRPSDEVICKWTDLWIRLLGFDIQTPFLNLSPPIDRNTVSRSRELLVSTSRFLASQGSIHQAYTDLTQHIKLKTRLRHSRMIRLVVPLKSYATRKTPCSVLVRWAAVNDNHKYSADHFLTMEMTHDLFIAKNIIGFISHMLHASVLIDTKWE